MKLFSRPCKIMWSTVSNAADKSSSVNTERSDLEDSVSVE